MHPLFNEFVDHNLPTNLRSTTVESITEKSLSKSKRRQLIDWHEMTVVAGCECQSVRFVG